MHCGFVAQLPGSVDFMTHHRYYLSYSHPWEISGIPGPDSPMAFNEPIQQARIISALGLNQYHKLCSWALSQHRVMPISTEATPLLGAIISCSSKSQPEHAVQIASLTEIDLDADLWSCASDLEAEGKVREDGWTRYS